MICPNCGFEHNKPHQKYCALCGQPLIEKESETADAPVDIEILTPPVEEFDEGGRTPIRVDVQENLQPKVSPQEPIKDNLVQEDAQSTIGTDAEEDLPSPIYMPEPTEAPNNGYNDAPIDTSDGPQPSSHAIPTWLIMVITAIVSIILGIIVNTTLD